MSDTSSGKAPLDLATKTVLWLAGVVLALLVAAGVWWVTTMSGAAERGKQAAEREARRTIASVRLELGRAAADGDLSDADLRKLNTPDHEIRTVDRTTGKVVVTAEVRASVSGGMMSSAGVSLCSVYEVPTPFTPESEVRQHDVGTCPRS